MVSTAVKKHHDSSNSYKGKHLNGWLIYLEFGPLSSWGHSNMKTDMVLEKELRVEKELYLDHIGNRKWSETYETSKSTPTGTHFLQQRHI